MVKKLWRHLVEMCRIWFAPKFNITYVTTGRYPCCGPRSRQGSSVSKPRAFLSRRFAFGRGNRDVEVGGLISGSAQGDD